MRRCVSAATSASAIRGRAAWIGTEQITHTTGLLGGGFASMHRGDFHIPCGCCCILEAGLRMEYSIVNTTSLIQTPTSLQEVSILFNIGVRY